MKPVRKNPLPIPYIVFIVKKNFHIIKHFSHILVIGIVNPAKEKDPGLIYQTIL